MFVCHKCSKPVFFAERKSSLGYDWHPECLRCQECGKRLNPGQHAEHKGIPYCHVPCYGALFGPQLFGHGTRVESHKSYGQKGLNHHQKISSGPQIPLAQIESKLKLYNQFFDNKSLEIRSREVNGRLVLEGALRIYWGIQGIIHLKEDDDQRTVVTIRKRNSVRYPNSVDIIRNTLYNQLESENSTNGNKENTTPTTDNDTTISESLSYDTASISSDFNSLGSPSSSKETSPAHVSSTLPSKLDVKQMNWDEIDDLLVVERKIDDSQQLYSTMPAQLPSVMTGSTLSDISTDLSMSMTDDNTTSYKTLGPDNDTTESSQTIYYSPLQSSNEKTPEDPPSANDDEEEETPTLKPQDFEDFKKQTKKEYILSANAMKNITDGTLKANQPIDPSRINDSLKLYTEGIMSRSMNENSPGIYSLSTSCFIPGQITSFNISDNLDVFKNHSSSSSSDDKTLKHESNLRSPYAHLKKSISMGSSTTTESHADDDSWMQGRGLLKSKSGPNYFQEYPSDTVKPSGKASTSISIKMDCYDQIQNNLSNSSSNSTTPTTPTSSGTYGTAETHFVNEDGVMLRRPPKTGSKAIKRRSGNRRSRTKLKRRCSINGHYYDRETSFFTPPHGSAMTVWVTSMVNVQEVVNLVMEKYKIESKAENFGLYIIKDNGEQKRLKPDEYPLVTRVILGPHEDVAKLFLMDSQQTQEISPEVAQFLNLSIPECHAILNRYTDEENRELQRIQEKYTELRRRIKQRMESLKVRL